MFISDMRLLKNYLKNHKVSNELNYLSTTVFGVHILLYSVDIKSEIKR